MAKPVKNDDTATKEQTPSGADIENVEQLNPAPVLEQQDQDNPNLDPLTRTIIDDGSTVEKQAVLDEKDPKGVAGKTGVHHNPEANASLGQRDVDRYGDFDKYGHLRESGAQPPGGGGSTVSKPNPAHTKDYGPQTGKTAIEHIADMMSVYPDDTPDSHIIYGYAGRILNVGHLREIAKQFTDFLKAKSIDPDANLGPD